MHRSNYSGTHFFNIDVQLSRLVIAKWTVHVIRPRIFTPDGKIQHLHHIPDVVAKSRYIIPCRAQPAHPVRGMHYGMPGRVYIHKHASSRYQSIPKTPTLLSMDNIIRIEYADIN